MYLHHHHTEFMTITNLNWLPVLNKDHHKQIVVEALRHRVKADVLTLYAFVLMPNHFHAIWQIHDHVKGRLHAGPLEIYRKKYFEFYACTRTQC